MAGKTLIGGTAYEIKGGRTLVNGTAYGISGGKTLVNGTAYGIHFVETPKWTYVASLPTGSGDYTYNGKNIIAAVLTDDTDVASGGYTGAGIGAVIDGKSFKTSYSTIPSITAISSTSVTVNARKTGVTHKLYVLTTSGGKSNMSWHYTTVTGIQRRGSKALSIPKGCLAICITALGTGWDITGESTRGYIGAGAANFLTNAELPTNGGTVSIGGVLTGTNHTPTSWLMYAAYGGMTFQVAYYGP